uniref:Candidate secreted effector n=1 Tax=Meloidogyne incognita TaxID=6306 RepID=A0A914LAY4_MELIC
MYFIICWFFETFIFIINMLGFHIRKAGMNNLNKELTDWKLSNMYLWKSPTITKIILRSGHKSLPTTIWRRLFNSNNFSKFIMKSIFSSFKPRIVSIKFCIWLLDINGRWQNTKNGKINLLNDFKLTL